MPELKPTDAPEFLRAHNVLEMAIRNRTAPQQADLDRAALDTIRAWLEDPEGEKFRILRDKFRELLQCSRQMT